MGVLAALVEIGTDVERTAIAAFFVAGPVLGGSRGGHEGERQPYGKGNGHLEQWGLPRLFLAWTVPNMMANTSFWLFRRLQLPVSTVPVPAIPTPAVSVRMTYRAIRPAQAG